MVATRGAEPIAEGGYRAVVLLDGDRMLQAEDLRIGESCLRWWSNAAALAAPGVARAPGRRDRRVARALATWTQPAYARAELADRAPLRMPPTVRVAALEGARASVETAIADAARGGARARRRGDPRAGRRPRPERARWCGSTTRTALRVAESLRGSIVADALRARKNAKTRAPGARHTLRVRVDVPDLDL